jgi:hypothetical protein
VLAVALGQAWVRFLRRADAAVRARAYTNATPRTYCSLQRNARN